MIIPTSVQTLEMKVIIVFRFLNHAVESTASLEKFFLSSSKVPVCPVSFSAFSMLSVDPLYFTYSFAVEKFNTASSTPSTFNILLSTLRAQSGQSTPSTKNVFCFISALSP